MTLVLVGIVAATALVGVVVLTLVLTRRSRRAAQDRVAGVITTLEARMDDLAGELAGALERAEEQTRKNRFLGDLAGSIDLDDVLARVLNAAGTVDGADAALVRIPTDGRPLVATLGLSTEEAERHAVTDPPDGRAARSISISYRYGAEEAAAHDDLLRAGLAVPLIAEDRPTGFLAVFTRSPSVSFGEDALVELEEIAARAAPVIANAQRFREARQQADLDALTGLHNRRYFHDTLAREVARAHRYDRRLALIVFDLDDFKEINDRVGHLTGDAVLAEAAERVRGVVRSADIACRVGGDEFAVILPESTLTDADQLYRRLQAAVSATPIGQVPMLLLSAGVAELRPEDDPTSFFQRADDALYRAKESGKGKVVAASAT